MEIFIVASLILSMLVLFAWIILLLRFMENMNAIPSLKEYSAEDPSSVSVIIPVRYDYPEECLKRLYKVSCVNEIFIVDDNSGEEFFRRLQALQNTDQRIKVLKARGEGKPAACQTGAEVASSEYLLFLDADTLINDGAIEKAINLMHIDELDALSVIGELRCKDIDAVTTPFSFGLLCSFVSFKDLAVQGKGGFFFGSFILFKRDPYFRIGGHAAVSGIILEDKALGELAKRNGLKIAIAKGKDLVSAEWAPGIKNNIEAIRRVLVPSMSGKALWSLAIAIGLSFLLLLPLFMIITAYSDMSIVLINLLSVIVQFVFTLYSCTILNVRPQYSILFLLSDIIIFFVFWQSFFYSIINQEITWKGRRYRV